LKVNDENSRIRVQHPDPNPDISQRHGSADPESTPKCHGSGTLVVLDNKSIRQIKCNLHKSDTKF